MATRQLLEALARAYGDSTGEDVRVESVGGVDAARRVQAGEDFDFAVLASDAIDKLIAGGWVEASSRTDVVRSDIAVAVRAGAPRPDIGSEAALRSAVLAAGGISYSTGPSGVYLNALFQRWGIAEQLRPRIVVPRPGVPVGTLLASGEVGLGFQQLSELMNLPGVDLVGPLPPEVQFTTVFTAGVCTASRRADAARAFLAFMASPQTVPVKQRCGMTAA